MSDKKKKPLSLEEKLDRFEAALDTERKARVVERKEREAYAQAASNTEVAAVKAGKMPIDVAEEHTVSHSLLAAMGDDAKEADPITEATQRGRQAHGRGFSKGTDLENSRGQTCL